MSEVTNYITQDELSTIFEIINTLNELSEDAQNMFNTFNLYDVNGEPLCSIKWDGADFTVALILEKA